MKGRLLERAILLDADDRDGLLRELRGLGLQPRVDATGLVRVAYEGPTAQPIVAQLRTPLSVLRVHDPSLEEAYVELLRRSDGTEESAEEAAA